VRVSKLALILPTSTLDCIFDDSGEKKFSGGPVQVRKVGQKLQKMQKSRFLPRICNFRLVLPSYGGVGGAKFFVFRLLI
jgi:hypothetical protein